MVVNWALVHLALPFSRRHAQALFFQASFQDQPNIPIGEVLCRQVFGLFDPLRQGFEPRFALSGGGADANVFNMRGLTCVNLANGMAEIHTPDEHIAVADLEAMVEVTLALVDAAQDAG